MAARYSGHLAAFLAAAGITAAFAVIRRRAVNVLREEVFPLLAVWLDRAGDDAEETGDGGFTEQAEFVLLAAARLAEGEAQDLALGGLIKVLKDAAESMAVAGVEYQVGPWEADNNADGGEGDRVWAAAPLTIRFDRPRGDY